MMDINYVISVLKGEKPTYEPEWFNVLSFLDLHRIGGLFFNKIKMLDIDIPNKVFVALETTYKKQKQRVQILRSAISEISQCLIKNNVEHVFLKGSIFSNVTNELKIYQDGERSSNDIDILVKPQNITEVTNALREIGFVQGKYDEKKHDIAYFDRVELIKRRMNRGEIAPFIKLTDNPDVPFIEIDINFSLGNIPNEDKNLLMDMLESRYLYGGKISLYGLDKEMFFIQLIMHQYKESCLYFMVKRRKDLAIYKLADIYYLLKNNAIDLLRLDRLISQYCLTEKVGTVLYQVAEVIKDKGIMNHAEKYIIKEPLIIDYETRKKFRYAIGIQSRLKLVDPLQYLVEIEDKNDK